MLHNYITVTLTLQLLNSNAWMNELGKNPNYRSKKKTNNNIQRCFWISIKIKIFLHAKKNWFGNIELSSENLVVMNSEFLKKQFHLLC